MLGHIEGSGAEVGAFLGGNEFNKVLKRCIDCRLEHCALKVAEVMLKLEVAVAPQTMTAILAYMLNERGVAETTNFYNAFLRKELVEPNIHHFSSLIRGSKHTDQALAFIDQMNGFHLKPNVFSYTAAIASCEATGDWIGALGFLQMMRAASPEVTPNDVTYSCLISVAASANMSHIIYGGIIDDMQRVDKLGVNLICFSKALIACARARLYGDVDKLLHDMDAADVVPDTGTFLSIVASYRYLAKTGTEDPSKLRVAITSLMERWAGHPRVDDTVYVSAMDLLDQIHCSSDVMRVYDLAKENNSIVTKATLQYSFRAMTKMRDLDRAEELLEDARQRGLATARMYNATMILADTVGRHHVALDLLLSLVGGQSGVDAKGKKRCRLRPPQRFVRSRVLSNALLSLTEEFSTAFVDAGQGCLEPSPEVVDLHDSLVELLPLEICSGHHSSRVLLRPGAYPMATKVLLDARDYSSLRVLLNQTLYMPQINSTKLYEFSIKGLTLVFPLRDGVRTTLSLIQDCVNAGASDLGKEMLTLAMNRIYNVPSITRSSIDRTFLDPTRGGCGAPVRFQRQTPQTSRNSKDSQRKLGKGMRSDTREKLLILMHTRTRRIIGAANMPSKSYRLAALACQNAFLFEKAVSIYQQAAEDGKLDTFTSNVVVGTLSRSDDFWDTALDIFEEMPVKDAYGFLAALVACETGGDWEQAIYLLNRARENGLPWSTSMVTTAIAACGSAGRADEALGLLEQSAADGVPLNTVAFNAAIFACVGHHRGEPRWREAEDLLLLMQDNAVWPNRVSYNALIEALGEAGEYEKADEWYLDAVTVGVLSPFKDLARHGWVDLHMHSVAMARSAVQMTFSTLRALHTQDAMPNEGEIVFIVGKGRKLLQAINQHLAEAFDPPIRCHVHSSNLGRLLLNKQDVMHHMNQ
jgi:pentatricopeptide repeat protein